jgi:hypothetical protein
MAYGIHRIAIRPGPPAELALGTLKEEHMRLYRYVGSFLLGAALIAPAGMLAGTNFQDDHHQNQKRYYDKSHKDYHNWDDREAGAYQRWTTENHRDNRDFSHLKRKEQSEYWNWRHDHPDDDKDRH